MNKKTKLSEKEIREKIIEDHNKGRSVDEIANRYGYHPSSITKIIRNFKGKKNFNRKKGAGRPQILSQSDKQAIVNCIRSKPWLSSAKIKERLNISAQPRTIRKYLEDLHYRFRKPCKKPKLSKKDKDLRLDWALQYKNYDFSNVVFADECSIWMREWSGMMWIKKGSQSFVGVQAHPQKVHVWGALGKDGVLGINVFTGNLNAPKLIAILKESLIDEANNIYGKGHWSLAHDNDPKHRATATKNFLKNEKVLCI